MKHDDKWLEIYANLLKDKVVLELGAGEGRDSKILQSICSQLFVTDIELAGNDCGFQVRIDHGKSIPFKDASFDVVVASLSLHYFSSSTTQEILRDVTRVLKKSGKLLCRLNSNLDTNYGAGKGVLIEPGFYRVGSKTKRFFTRSDVFKYLSEYFVIESCDHKTIDRYMYPKSIFEVVASSA